MKKLALFALAAAFCLPAIAQTSGGSMGQSGASTPAKATSMIGCVSQSDGKFMAMNKANPKGVQLMTSEDLTAHVGHKMKFTGTMSADKMSMNVTGMKMISTTCGAAPAKMAPMSQ
jgi:hypothetical protein